MGIQNDITCTPREVRADCTANNLHRSNLFIGRAHPLPQALSIGPMSLSDIRHLISLKNAVYDDNSLSLFLSPQY